MLNFLAIILIVWYGNCIYWNRDMVEMKKRITLSAVRFRLVSLSGLESQKLRLFSPIHFNGFGIFAIGIVQRHPCNQRGFASNKLAWHT